jgi:CheY-like chemotaxis protein
MLTLLLYCKVLINLITNAIKFTRLESKRHISVSVGASVNQPVSTPGGIKFIAPKLVPDAQLLENWKHDSSNSSHSPVLYIIFSVQDTGRGLSEEEIQHLFARFSQASPRTHINYGGSGLGLFISRRLTEMQGGAIGLSSVEKRGSTFAFYIRVRRVMSADVEKRRGSAVDIEERKKRLAVPEGTGNGNANIDASVKPMRPPILRQASNNTIAIARELDVATSGDEEGRMEAETIEKKMPDPLHVLIVEDNIVNQKVLAKQLRNLGCVVSVANHGMECLEFLRGTSWWKGCPCSATATIKTIMKGDSREKGVWERDPNKDTEMQGQEEKQNSTHGRTCCECSDINVNKQVGKGEVGGLDLHLILLDSEMPAMNGLVCIQRIRALERDGHLAYMDAGPMSAIYDNPKDYVNFNTHINDDTNMGWDDAPRLEDAHTLGPDAPASNANHTTPIISSNRRIPVIGVTANVRQNQVQEALGMGMDDVVAKPCKTGEVWAAVVELLTG